MLCGNMDLSGYSSDSTYCSLFETPGNHYDTRNKEKRSKSTSEFLNEINEMVHLHIEEKHLMGIHDVQKYMKQLYRIPLKTNKHYLLADKLKSMLYQIYKWNKMFEKTFSNSIEFHKDSILDCGLTQDFQMMKENQNELRSIFLPMELASEPASFCSDMLSNKMFLTSSTVITNSTRDNKEAIPALECKAESVTNNNFTSNNKLIEKENQAGCSLDMFPTEENIDDVVNLDEKDLAVKNSTSLPDVLNISDSSAKTFSSASFQIADSNIMDINSVKSLTWLTSTQTITSDSTLCTSAKNPETEINIVSCSQETLREGELFKVPPPKPHKKYKYRSYPLTPENSADRSNIISIQDSFPGKSEMSSSTNHSHKNLSIEAPGQMYVIPQTQEDELTSLASKIADMQQRLFPMKTLFPEINNFSGEKVDPQISFQAATNLGSAFHECYNDKIAKLHCDVGSGARSWDQVQEDLDYVNALADKTAEALSLAFDNIHLQEKRAVEREYREKVGKGNFHGFNEEDLRALEWEDFLPANEARLAELSAELKMRFVAEKDGPVQSNYFDEEDYGDLDWRNYNKDQ